MPKSNIFNNLENQKIKDTKINHGQNDGSFLEDIISDKNKETGFIGVSLSNKRISFIFFIVVILLLSILFRVVYLQVVRGEHYRSVAEGNRIRVIRKPAMRGVIYDRDKNVLAENIVSFELAIIPVDFPQDEQKRAETINWLAEVSLKNTDEIKNLIDNQSTFSYDPVVVMNNIEYQKAIEIKLLTSNIAGVVLIMQSKRHYPATEQDYSYSHILGYPGKISSEEFEQYQDQGYLQNDSVGKDGIEKYYEKVLRGKDGVEKIEVDAFGNQSKIISKEEPIPGSNLVLTIDSDLQRIAKDALFKTLRAYGKKRGSVIILEPGTGAVLALVSLPTYDNNDFTLGISQEKFDELLNDKNLPLFNRAISGQYPSGSTIKPIVAIAGLEENIVTSNTKINSTGGISVENWFYPDWKEGGHGSTDVKKAIAESINTFFYLVGGGYEDFEGLGLEKLNNYFTLFGLGNSLGIDLPNEASGLVPDDTWKQEVKGEPWFLGDTYHLSIGQGDILVTVLQAATWMNFFASDGKLLRPYIVKEILDTQGNVVKQIKPQNIRQDFIEDQNVITVQQGLRQTVTSGSAVGLQGVGMTSAGKTGTAQWLEGEAPHSWFTGYASYNNPEIAIAVLVEEGSVGINTAQGVAAEIFMWWAQNR
ncbi:penicillin-binding protein 2 [Patescibacteria group bacterium]|nr:penicillin-binding protein 2 [Patescibacteria group bacterium]